MVRVLAPTDTRFSRCSVDGRQIAFAESETVAQKRLLQKVQHPFGFETGGWQVEKLKKSLFDALFCGRCPVGNGIWESDSTVGDTEYRLNIRRVKGNIGCQYGNVGGVEFTTVIQHCQQLVAQHLHFPHGAMAHMNLQGAIIAVNQLAVGLFTRFCRVHCSRFSGEAQRISVYQVQYIRLERM